MRSRAVSLPRPCCASMRAWPPPSRARARRRSSLSSICFTNEPRRPIDGARDSNMARAALKYSARRPPRRPRVTSSGPMPQMKPLVIVVRRARVIGVAAKSLLPAQSLRDLRRRVHLAPARRAARHRLLVLAPCSIWKSSPTWAMRQASAAITPARDREASRTEPVRVVITCSAVNAKGRRSASSAAPIAAGPRAARTCVTPSASPNRAPSVSSAQSSTGS